METFKKKTPVKMGFEWPENIFKKIQSFA